MMRFPFGVHGLEARSTRLHDTVIMPGSSNPSGAIMPRQRPIRLDDLFKLRAISSMSMSPDGGRIVFAMKRSDAKNNRNLSSLYVVETKGGRLRRLTHGDFVDVNPRWSPAGDAVAFMSNRDKGVTLWHLPMDGGEPERLTDRDEQVASFDWSPDGRRIVFSARHMDEREMLERDEKHDALRKRPAFRHVTRLWHRLDGEGWWNGNYRHLHVLTIATGKAKRLTNQKFDDQDPVFSPDGKTIAFWSNRKPDPDRDIENGDIFTIPARGGTVRQITDHQGPGMSPAWSPDGKTIAFLASVAPPGMSVCHNLQVWTISAAGRSRPTVLTAKIDNNCRNETMGDVATSAFAPIAPLWSADGRNLYVAVAERGATNLYRLDAGKGGGTAVVAGKHTVNGYGRSKDGAVMCLLIGDALNPCDVFAWDPADAAAPPRQLTHVNEAALKGIALCAPEEFEIRGKHGPVHGWVVGPQGGRKGGRRPGILSIHGGPQGQFGYCFMHELQWLAAEGYVVAYGNPRGSAGYGRTFRGCIVGCWGKIDHDDCNAIADYLAKRKDVDAKRLGITGGSYGGYMTNWMIAHTHRFKAAVTQRSVVNLESMFGTSDYGWDLADAFGGVPWKKRAHYVDRSPLSHAPKIKTPLLIIHSEQDLRCPIEQAEQLFATLKYLGRTVELVRFEGESHGLSRGGRPQNRAERLRRIHGWFKKYL
jgi:dipeptidyl aminopeptidase/acylaminoacyl peptidase